MKKSKCNQKVKKVAIIVGICIFIFNASHISNIFENALFPRDKISTYLLDENKRTGFSIIISEVNGSMISSIHEHSEGGIEFYNELYKAKPVELNYLIDDNLIFDMNLYQDNDDDRFRKIQFKVIPDEKKIILTYELKSYCFSVSEKFIKLFLKYITISDVV